MENSVDILCEIGGDRFCLILTVIGIVRVLLCYL